MYSIFLTISTYGQPSVWRIEDVKTIENTNTLQIDALGNIFLTKKDGFQRISPTGQRDSLITKKWGDLSSIDIKFSLKTLCYFKDNNLVVILDDRLGQLSQFRLNQVGIYNSNFAKFSSDGMIWVYNSDDQSLYKINENNFVKFKAKNPFTANNISYNPQFFFDLKNQLIACDTSFGLFLLDAYGNQISNSPIDSIQNVFLLQDHVVVKKNEQLFWLNESLEIENNWTIDGEKPPFDPKSINFVQFMNRELWTLDKASRLTRYKKQ
jgi:hypothetical protein